MTTIDPQNASYGSVASFAEMIRSTLAAVSVAYRLDHIDSVTTGILRSLISGPGTDNEVRTWFRNALDAGDLVRAELESQPEPFYPDDDCSDDESIGGDPRSGCAITPKCALRCYIRHQAGEAQLNDPLFESEPCDIHPPDAMDSGPSSGGDDRG